MGMGEVVGFRENLSSWGLWEEEYARRGFKTINLDDFENANYDMARIKHLLGIKRQEKEEPVFHAKNFGKPRDLESAMERAVDPTKNF